MNSEFRMQNAEDLQPSTFQIQHSQKGFTLMELLMIIGVMALIAGMSISLYARFLTQNAVSNTGEQIVGSLRKAQVYSMMSRKSSISGWGVDYRSNTITLFQGANYAGRVEALDEKFTVNPAVTVSGLTEISYSRVTGIPNASPTITISGSGDSQTLTVYSTGAVSK